jgi:hypothetical protein
VAHLLSPEKKSFPLIIYSDKGVQKDSSLQAFVQVFSQVVQKKNNDLPTLQTFLQISINTKLSFPGFSVLILETFLPLFIKEPLSSVHSFLEKVNLLDPLSKKKENKLVIEKFLDSFDFNQEKEFKLMTDFFLKTKDNFGIDLGKYKDTIDTSFQKMVEELPFDLVSLTKTSSEAQKVNHVIEKIIKIAFETCELSLLKHLFHIFSDKQNHFLRVFETTLTSVCSDSQIPEKDLIEYAHDLVDCVYFHRQKTFPDQYFHRLNIFTYILLPICNLLEDDSLVELMAAYFSDWIHCLHQDPPSLVIACNSSLKKAHDLFLRQHIILKLFSLTFKRLEKADILNKLYPRLESEEYPKTVITKKIIKRVTELELSLDTTFQVLTQVKQEQFGLTLELAELLLYLHSIHFRASLFGCLSSLLMKTQSQLATISDFLIFKRKGKQTQRMARFLPPHMKLNFGVHTYFEIQSLNDLGASLMKSFKSSMISQKFLAFQSKPQKSIENEYKSGSIKQTIDKENSIELDDINKLPISLELIDLFSSICYQFQLEKETAINSFGEVFKTANLQLHQKVILFKVLLNNPSNFENQKETFLPHILDFVCANETGGAGLHYFLRDILTLFCDWVEMNPKVLEMLPFAKDKVSVAAKNIIKKLADKSRLVSIHNFNLFLKFVDCTKDHLCLDLQYFLKMLGIKMPSDSIKELKEKRENLRLWKITALCVIETLVFKNIKVQFQNVKEVINSKKNQAMSKSLLNGLLDLIRNSSSRFLSLKSASVLGLYLRLNPWIWLKSDLCSLLTNSLFSLSSKSKNFIFSMLNHISYYFPKILFKNTHIRNLIQKSARTLKTLDVTLFLSCLMNLFQFKDDLSKEFVTNSSMVKTIFVDLVYFLEKTSNSSSKHKDTDCILVLLQKFIEVPFHDKVSCVRHLVEKLAHMNFMSFATKKRVHVHALIIRIASFLKSQEMELNEEENVPSFGTLNSEMMASVNESFQRIEDLHFKKEDSPEKIKGY